MDGTAQSTGGGLVDAPAVDAVSPPIGDAHDVRDVRAPELIGADELAAAPRPFPPLPVDATPLVQPPPPPRMPDPAPAQTVATGSSIASTPSVPVPSAPAPVTSAGGDFAALLAAPIHDPATRAPAVPVGTTAGERDIARSTVGERLTLVLAVLLPPIGLLLGIVGAILSSHRRGWVVGVLRASIAVGLILTAILGVGGDIGLRMLRQQQAHDRVVAASAAFCATIAKDPAMIRPPAFGWPAAASSVSDSLTTMQAFEDRWTELAAVSPAGVRSEVQKVATAAGQIVDGVTVARTVDDASDLATMTAVASASGVPAWAAEYCG